MALLEVKNLGISFGGLRAVDQFEINIKKGQLYGLIGPNGAGKTTIFNMLTFSSSTEKLVTLFTKLYQLLLRNTWAKSTKNWELTTIYSTTMVQKMQTA